MEKIKNAAHLREQKMKLRVKELELEKIIRKDWSEIREKLQPRVILKNELGANGEHRLLNGLNQLAASFTEKMMEKAEGKLQDKAEKGFSYIGRRISNLLKKK